ncbi:MAG: GIY-YIG nuclease family protein [Gammaproteobacteria bacterium]
MNARELNPPVNAHGKFSHPGSKLVPEQAGCYALTNYSGDILYVGQAKNLRQRMLSHLRGDEKRQLTPFGKASKFHYRLCEERKLSRLERGWINDFQLTNGDRPHFNKINPPV